MTPLQVLILLALHDKVERTLDALSDLFGDIGEMVPVPEGFAQPTERCSLIQSECAQLVQAGHLESGGSETHLHYRLLHLDEELEEQARAMEQAEADVIRIREEMQGKDALMTVRGLYDRLGTIPGSELDSPARYLLARSVVLEQTPEVPTRVGESDRQEARQPQAVQAPTTGPAEDALAASDGAVAEQQGTEGKPTDATSASKIRSKFGTVKVEKIIERGDRPGGRTDSWSKEVARLVESITATGLLQPIVVRPVLDTDQYELLAGRGRLAAFTKKGHKRILCHILEGLDDLQAELVAIDENLVRRKLSALDRGVQMKRRKEIYESLNPSAARPSGGRKPKNDETISSFSAETAEQIGVSPRTVQHDVQIGTDITEEAQGVVRGTATEHNKTALLDLARLDREEQVPVARLLVDGTATSVAEAAEMLQTQQSLPSADVAAGGNTEMPAKWQILTADPVKAVRQLPTKSARLAIVVPPLRESHTQELSEMSDPMYQAWCRDWLRPLLESLTPDASLWLVLTDSQAAVFGNLLWSLKLHRRAWVKIWERPCVPRDRNFAECSRLLFYYVRNPDNVIFEEEALKNLPGKPNGKKTSVRTKFTGDVWEIDRLKEDDGERIAHFPHQIPAALLRPVIACATRPGDLIVNPFSHCATAGFVALEQGRQFLGIEADERLAERSRERLREFRSATEVQGSWAGSQ